MKIFSGSKVAVFCAIAVGSFGCAVGPSIQDAASNTPAYYTENRFFYLKYPSTRHTPCDQTAVATGPATNMPSPAAGKDTFDPQHPDYGISLAGNTSVELVQGWQVAAEGECGRTRFKEGDPMAVILQGVRLPDDLPGLGTRDIAVILDVNMGPGKGLQSFVAFYQRDVPPGQMLNFANLTVFSTSKLDPAVAPYFRVRVMDVRAERNAQARELLDAAAKINGEISGLVPHPVIPIVNTAIQAAKVVLANQRNQTLLDFQVQLYQAAQANSAGDANLTRLYEGTWLVLGRERGQTSDFWNTTLYLNQRNDQIVARPPLADRIRQVRTAAEARRSPYNAVGEEDVYVPYVRIALARMDLQVPSVVMDRAQKFLEILTSPSSKTDIDAFVSAAGALSSSVHVYQVIRDVKSSYSPGSMQQLIDALRADDVSKQMSDGDKGSLVAFVSSLVPDQTFTNAKDVIEWWNKGGNGGHFDKDHHWVVDKKAEPAANPAPGSPSNPGNHN